MNADYVLFSNLRSKCHSEASKCYRQYIENTEANVMIDSKQFWNFINANRNENGYPSEMYLGSEVANNVADIGYFLNFSKAYIIYLVTIISLIKTK